MEAWYHGPMKKWIPLALLSSSLSFGATNNHLFDSQEPKEILIQNRVLLKIGDQAITLLDVVKKMDLIFYRQYPQFASNLAARYQFYSASWETILNAVIDEHLMVADAEEKQVVVSDGDVREELESIFGPDVVFRIDQLGMTYDEAFDLLKREITVNRMQGMMVHSKAQSEVSPKEVVTAYEAYLAAHPPEEWWSYRILSFKSDDARLAQERGELARLLFKEGIPLAEIPARLQTNECSCTLSDAYKTADKDLGMAYKSVLLATASGALSEPFMQSKGGSATARLFFLQEHRKEEAPQLKEMQNKLHQELLQKAIVRHSAAYQQKLREHYGVSESLLGEALPEDAQFFALR